MTANPRLIATTTGALCPTGNQRRLDYTRAAATNVRSTLNAARRAAGWPVPRKAGGLPASKGGAA